MGRRVVLDVSGLGRLLGDPQAIGAELDRVAAARPFDGGGPRGGIGGDRADADRRAPAGDRPAGAHGRHG